MQTSSNAASNFHARAILVSLRMPTWSATKDDKQVTSEVAAAHGASADCGTFRKNLLPGSELEVPDVALTPEQRKKQKSVGKTVSKAHSYKALMAHIRATRQWHYAQTLPWSDAGWRILPIKNYQAYTDGIREAQHKFRELLADFVRDYPALRELAQKLLNGIFKFADYPDDIEKRFKFTLETAPVPSGADFRVALSDTEIAAIAANTEARVAEGFKAAQDGAVTRLFDCLAKIHARLTGSGASRKDGMQVFHDSLIENARSICETLKVLNIADDPELERFRREIELIAASEASTLREYPTVRAETANRAQNILDAMRKTYGSDLLG